MNKCLLIGRVKDDLTFGVTKSGVPGLTIMLETITKWISKDQKPQQKADVHTVVQWGKLAELSYRNIKRGDLISVEGALTSSYFEEDGEKKNRNEIKAQLIEVLERSK